jgi:hypothetical protein
MILVHKVIILNSKTVSHPNFNLVIGYAPLPNKQPSAGRGYWRKKATFDVQLY